MGDVGFILSHDRGLFLERKFRNNGLYEVENFEHVIANNDDQEQLSPTPINLSTTRKDMLDQFDDEESFFIKRLRGNFIVNKSFMASITLKQVKENNVFKKHLFVAKKANFWL